MLLKGKKMQIEATFNGGKSVGHRIVSAVTSSPARMRGLANFSDDHSDEVEGGTVEGEDGVGVGGWEHEWMVEGE